MSTSPFELFRRNLKPLMIALTVLAMLAFVVLPAVDSWVRQGGPGGGENAVVASYKGGTFERAGVNQFTQNHYLTLQFLSELANETAQRGGTLNVPGFAYDEQRQQISEWGISSQPSMPTSVSVQLYAERALDLGFDLDHSAVKVWLSNFSDNKLTDTQINQILRRATDRQLGQHDMLEQLRIQLLSNAVQQTSMSGLFASNRSTVPPVQQYALYLRLNQRAKAVAYPVLVDDYLSKTNSTPSDAEIQRVYDEGKEVYPDETSDTPGFRRRTSATFEVVSGDFDAFIKRLAAEVPEEELREEYERQVASGGFVVPESMPGEDESGAPAPPSDVPPNEADATPADGTDEPPMTETPAPETPAEPAPETPAEPAPETPAEPAPETPAEPAEPAAEGEEPMEEQPAAESPAEPAAEGEEPTEEQPVTETPAEPTAEGESEEPAEEQPAAETPAEPVSETPAEPAPETEDQSSRTLRGAVQLVAFRAQEDGEDEAPAEGSEAPETPADSPETPADSPETPADSPEPPADSPETPAAPEGDTPEASPATEETPDEASTPPKVRPFEEVRDQIAEQLVTPDAFGKVREGIAKVKDAMRKYSVEHAIYQAEVEDQTAEGPPPERPDIEALAKEYGLSYETLGPHDIQSIQDTDVGQSSIMTGQFQMGDSFPQLMFGGSEGTYSPVETTNFRSGQSFVSWKTEETPDAIPMLVQVRDEVISAIRYQEARQLAREAAQELAAKANASPDKPLEEIVPEDRKEFVQDDLGEFPWMLWLGPGRMPMIWNLEALNQVGDEFMRQVFMQPLNEFGVAPNEPKSVYYVVKTTQRSPSQEELRKQFMQASERETVRGMMGQETFELSQAYQQQFREDLGLKWDTEE